MEYKILPMMKLERRTHEKKKSAEAIDLERKQWLAYNEKDIKRRAEARARETDKLAMVSTDKLDRAYFMVEINCGCIMRARPLHLLASTTSTASSGPRGGGSAAS